jgi:integrase/recombinase XerD
MNQNFKGWIINKGLGVNTANDYNKFIEKKFLSWLHENQLTTGNLEHETLMQYIRYRKARGVKAKTINLELKQISWFLDFKCLPNVAEPIRVKGVSRRIPHDLFTEKELDEIYQRFPGSRSRWTNEDTIKRYHLILGLKIYQGLQEQELSKIEISHLQLDKGKIYIPSTKRTNKRVLDLKPFQILPLHEHVLTERLSLKEEIEGNYLFHPERLKRSIPRITRMINRYEPRLTSMLQIRSSVITNWLKHHNSREVQYMAGHRYVSSTERYRADHLEDLQKELEKYHPLR